MARLSQEKINEIRQSVDIVDVIGEYLPLEKKGRNYIALCPFHDDKHPSMSVSPDKQIFMCFVCVGGCVFCCVLGLGFGVECFLFWEMGCGWKGGCFFVRYVLYVCGEFGVKLFVDDLFLGWGFVCSRVVFLL